MNYSQSLQDPRWQEKRLEILSRDLFTCRLCADKKTTLHVHHKYYLRGMEPWEYKDQDLTTLCKHCHEAYTTYERANGKPLFFEVLKFTEGGKVVVISLTEKGMNINYPISFLHPQHIHKIVQFTINTWAKHEC